MNTVDRCEAAPAAQSAQPPGDGSSVVAAAAAPAPAAESISPRRLRTRTKLIEAAIPLLAAKGVAGTSIEEFAEAAGMTRGAFYSNFASRDALVLAVCDSGIKRAMDRVNEAAESGLDEVADSIGTADPQRLMELALERFFIEYPESVDWVLAEREIHLHALRVPEPLDKYEELLAAYFRQFAAVIDTVLDRLGGRTTIPAAALVELLAVVVKEASVKAIPEWPGTGPLIIDPQPTFRILRAFVVFD
ncbi:TetR/AcrR family transcriptional regulator [Brevibacterium sp. NPDC049920]|uniref:TetR/AcrR family transcriptional regulator n=1 Tax=Brevibacterium sp. NPDC049920 TaxID=3155279 RepID=UPI0033F89234